jgi:lysophospholipase L1-like esterase
VHIGDSTSEGLISRDYLPKRSQRLAAQYAGVGVRTTRPEISGARSIVETLPGQTNGYQTARSLVRQGYHGCWVIALGTNDTADVVVGSQVGLAARIARMMQAVHGQPVMWVNVKSTLVNGPYAEPHMQAWDQALARACPRYPNMRVFDWASVVRRGWFISDGVHYTPTGYLARGRLIAEALARAFPAAGHSAGCVVRLPRPAPPGRPRDRYDPPLPPPRRPNMLNSRSPASAAVSATPFIRPRNGSSDRFQDS